MTVRLTLTDTQIAALKSTLLPRAPACFFTEDDADVLRAECGIDKLSIHQWAANVCERVPPDYRSTYLSSR